MTAPFPAQNCDLFRTVRFFVGLFGIEFGIASGMNGVDRISKNICSALCAEKYTYFFIEHFILVRLV